MENDSESAKPNPGKRLGIQIAPKRDGSAKPVKTVKQKAVEAVSILPPSVRKAVYSTDHMLIDIIEDLERERVDSINETARLKNLVRRLKKALLEATGKYDELKRDPRLSKNVEKLETETRLAQAAEKLLQGQIAFLKSALEKTQLQLRQLERSLIDKHKSEMQYQQEVHAKEKRGFLEMIVALKNSVKENLKQKQVLRREIEKKIDIDIVEKERKQATHAREVLEDQNTVLRNELQKNKADLEELGREMFVTTSELKELREISAREKKHLTQSVAAMKTELKLKFAEREALKKELNKKIDIEVVEEERKQALEKQDILHRQIEFLKTTIQSNLKQTKEIESKLQNIDRQLGVERARYKHEKESLNSRVSELAEQLKEESEKAEKQEQELTQTIAVLKEELYKKKNEAQMLENSVANKIDLSKVEEERQIARAAYEELQKQNFNLKMHLKKSGESVREAQGKTEETEKELQEERERAGNEVKILGENIAALEKELESIRSEKSELNQELERRVHPNDVEAVKRQSAEERDALKNQINFLKTSLQKNNEKSKDYEARIEELDNALRSKTANANQEKTAFNEKVSELELQLTESARQNDQLKKQMHEKVDLTVIEEERERTRAEFDQLKEQSQAYETALQHQHQTLKKLETALKEEEEQRKLENEVAAAEKIDLTQKIEKLQADLNANFTERQQLKLEVAKRIDYLEVEAERKEAANEKERLQKQVKFLKGTNQRHQSSFEELKTQLTQDIQQKDETLDAVNKERQSLEEKVLKLDSLLRQSLKQKQILKDSMKFSVDRREADKTQQRMRDAYRALEQEKETIESALEKNKEQVRELDNRAKKAESELNSEKARAHKDKTGLTDVITALKAAIRENLKQKDALKAESDEKISKKIHEEQLQMAEQARELLQRQMHFLKTTLQKSHAQRAELEKELSQRQKASYLVQELKKAEEGQDLLKRQISFLKSSLTKSHEQKAALEKEVERRLDPNDYAEERKNQFSLQETLKKQLELLKNTMKKTLAEKEELSQTLEATSAELVSEKEENQKLRAEIKSHQKAIEVMLETSWNNKYGEDEDSPEHPEALKKKNAELRETVAQQKKEIDQMLYTQKTEVDEMFHKMVQERADFKKQLEVAEKMVETWKGETQKLRSRLEFVEADNQRRWDEIKELTKQKKELETAIWTEHNSFSKLIDRLEHEKKELEEKFKTTREEAGRWKNDYQAIVQKISAVEREKTALQEMLDKKENMLNSWQQKFHEANTRVRILQEEQGSEKDVQKWKETCKELEKQVEAGRNLFRRQIEESADKIQMLNEHIVGLQATIDDFMGRPSEVHELSEKIRKPKEESAPKTGAKPIQTIYDYDEIEHLQEVRDHLEAKDAQRQEEDV